MKTYKTPKIKTIVIEDCLLAASINPDMVNIRLNLIEFDLTAEEDADGDGIRDYGYAD